MLLRLTILTFLLQTSPMLLAQTVAFEVESKGLRSPLASPQSTNTTVDVFVDVSGAEEISAVGWGLVLTITPTPEATGFVVFDPPPIENSLPNLSPASINPLIDFDRDFGGASFAEASPSGLRLEALAGYIPPVSNPAPLTDSNGNIFVPNGAGLLSVPLFVSADATGEFTIGIDAAEGLTGFVANTGLAQPNDLTLVPTSDHVAGVLTVVKTDDLVGDFNQDGRVDAVDYTIWRDQKGASVGSPFEGPDANGDKVIGPIDYDLWAANYGLSQPDPSSATVPEPASILLMLVGLIYWKGQVGAMQRGKA